MTSARPILRLESVSKVFDGLPVLDSIDLEIQPRQTTVIIGPSGCGKSVMLKHLIGLISPDSGKVFFEDREITSLSERELVPIRKRMGFLFQGGALFDSMTILENITFPMVEHNIGSAASRNHRCAEVLKLVGLDGMQERYPAELSGGQQKRIALARAIALDPDVIFYDEPTTGLDPIRADLINELILSLRNALDNTALVVTHDIDSARKIGDRILMLHKGRFILDAPPSEIDNTTNSIVSGFIQGKASEEELATIHGRLDREHGSGEERR